ncbi:hypothetical protein L218DRAFT_962843 [Marasmius fiardii PR-910]|nr:hypothetical protein L218DRAFT_962843 [Marasmius fiardii PR-910]
MVLIPPTLVRADDFDNGFSRAVQDLPDVDHDGQWKRWKESVSSPPPEVLEECVLFIVPREDYRKLSEGDYLTEMREDNFKKRPTRAPSAGAQPSQFARAQSKAPFDFSRPLNSERRPIPLCLLQKEFGEFQDNLRSAQLDPTLSKLGYGSLSNLSEIFRTEAARETQFLDFLQQLLGSGVVIESCPIGNCTTDGVRDEFITSELCGLPLLVDVKRETTVGTDADGIFEVVLCYEEAVRQIVVEKVDQGDHTNTRLPAILICHNGPNIHVLGALCLEAPQVQVLSQPVSLYFNPLETRTMEDYLRFLVSLRTLYTSLRHIYLNPRDNAVSPDQIDFPYINSFKPSPESPPVFFRYTSRMDTIRLVFAAEIVDDSPRPIIVKFGSGEYRSGVHRNVASIRLTPAILGVTESLPGGMWMVVMDELNKEFKCADEYDELPQQAVDEVRRAMNEFHELGYVHGDMRESNVFLRQSQSEGGDRWECQLLDMDWAGRAGEAKYPAGVYHTVAVWRPGNYLDQQEITVQHDRDTLERWLAEKLRN